MIASCRPRKVLAGVWATYSICSIFSTSHMKSPPLEFCCTGSAGGGRVSDAMSGGGTVRLVAAATAVCALADAVAPSAAPATVAPFKKRRRPIFSIRSLSDICSSSIRRAAHELLRRSVQEAKINVAVGGNRAAMSPGIGAFARQPFQRLAVQVAQHPAGPDLLVGGHDQRRQGADMIPFAEELAGGV